jgi:hypothetical protein
MEGMILECDVVDDDVTQRDITEIRKGLGQKRKKSAEIFPRTVHAFRRKVGVAVPGPNRSAPPEIDVEESGLLHFRVLTMPIIRFNEKRVIHDEFECRHRPPLR